MYSHTQVTDINSTYFGGFSFAIADCRGEADTHDSNSSRGLHKHPKGAAEVLSKNIKCVLKLYIRNRYFSGEHWNQPEALWSRFSLRHLLQWKCPPDVRSDMPSSSLSFFYTHPSLAPAWPRCTLATVVPGKYVTHFFLVLSICTCNPYSRDETDFYLNDAGDVLNCLELRVANNIFHWVHSLRELKIFRIINKCIIKMRIIHWYYVAGKNPEFCLNQELHYM